MAINFPGPYQLRVFYTSASRVHVQQLNLVLSADPAVGTPFSGINLLQRDTNTAVLSTAVDAWVVLVKALFASASATVDRAELWKYVAGTFDASYVSAYSIAVAGTSGSGVSNASEPIITFRTFAGGTMRLHWLDTVLQSAGIDSPPFADASLEAIRTFVESDDNWIYARDNSYPASAIAAYKGINERLFKKLFR
jgi:hypothetical protein